MGPGRWTGALDRGAAKTMASAPGRMPGGTAGTAVLPGIEVGTAHLGLRRPSLRTGLADLPHPTLQLVITNSNYLVMQELSQRRTWRANCPPFWPYRSPLATAGSSAAAPRR